jgi:hypothetical protein
MAELVLHDSREFVGNVGLLWPCDVDAKDGFWTGSLCMVSSESLFMDDSPAKKNNSKQRRTRTTTASRWVGPADSECIVVDVDSDFKV